MGGTERLWLSPRAMSALSGRPATAPWPLPPDSNTHTAGGGEGRWKVAGSAKGHAHWVHYMGAAGVTNAIYADTTEPVLPLPPNDTLPAHDAHARLLGEPHCPAVRQGRETDPRLPRANTGPRYLATHKANPYIPTLIVTAGGSREPVLATIFGGHIRAAGCLAWGGSRRERRPYRGGIFLRPLLAPPSVRSPLKDP